MPPRFSPYSDHRIDESAGEMLHSSMGGGWPFGSGDLGGTYGKENALLKNSFPIFVLAAKMVDLPKIFSTNVLFKLYNIIYRRPKHGDS